MPVQLAGTTEPSRSIRPVAPVLVAFVLAACAFVAAAIANERWVSGIDREAEQLEVNALPSVEHLAAARDALWHLDVASQAALEAPPDRRREADVAVQDARREVDRELAAELATEQYPSEAECERDLRTKLEALDGVLARARDVEHELAVAPAFLREERRKGFADADGALHTLMAVNAREGHLEARTIARIRTDAERLSFLVTLGCVLFAIAAALAAVRALQRQRDVERANEQILSARSVELERFAARVAHDLLSPLSALHFTLSSLRRKAEKGLSVAESVSRAEACLARSRALVEGVMDFARSGASPGPARANLKEGLDGVLDEVRSDAAGVSFEVADVESGVDVACSPGVLTSILSNLVQNAVKYMDDRPDRRVMVRVDAGHAMVRVEVEDTGPGIDPGLAKTVFDAYVRGPDNPKPGLGLGLATVQRFVTAHGGQVGVEAAEPSGCIFWFALPRI